MATARELLQQADALMRRNRQNEPEPDPDIPELTEVVGVEEADVDDDSIGDFGGMEASPIVVAESPVPPPVIADTGQGPDTFPVLTEVVAAPEAQSIAAPRDDSPDWIPRIAEEVEQSPAIAWPDAPETMPLPPVGPIVVPAVASAPPAENIERDAAQWERLAEDIRMQVLQRIDIFTDTGLQEQLKERLQPIVDRASADLVATINKQVGQLLRTYVAEAIEREIDKWRQGGG